MDCIEKTCSKCGEAKLLTEFYKSKKERLGVMSHCKECDKKKGKAYYAENTEKVNARTKANREADPEKKREQSKRWYEANKEDKLAKNAEWARANPERFKEYQRAWDARNPDASRIRNERRRKTPRGKLENAIRAGFHKGIKKGSKSSRKTFDLLGYTPDELMAHIEKQFLPGMSWDNHGRGEDCWHIDHIIPMSAFNFETPDDPDFKLCWALSNLRPLWEKDNLKKSDKIEKPFQPSLMLRAANDNKPPSDFATA